MIDPSVPCFPAQPVSWSEIARICRRICLLRERQQPDAAEDVRRRELAAALTEIRPSVESDAALEQKLDAIFAAETERVANAAVLAELLAPLLQEKSPALPRRESSPATFLPSPVLEPSVAPPRRDPADIAQFIDDMIAHERSSTRRVS